MMGHGFQCDKSAQRPASDGVTVNDTNSDVSVATVTTRPNSRKNKTTEPGKNEIGKNTTTSTSVITIAATPISFRPLTAASLGGSPRSKWRSTFSRTTIESSTRMPIMRVIAKSDTVSSVKCASFIAPRVTSSDDGIAIITTIALRHERKKKSMTMPVSTMAHTSVQPTSVNCCSVYVDCTFRISTCTSGYVRRSVGSCASTAREVSTSDVPADF